MLNIPENINNILQEFIVGVQNILGEHLKKVILYGSYARGDFTESSDIDIMILTDYNDDELEEKETEIWDFSYDLEEKNNFNVDLSPRIRNIEQFDKRAEFIPFYKNIQKEGVELVNGLWNKSAEKTEEQIETARELIELVEKYLKENYK